MNIKRLLVLLLISLLFSFPARAQIEALPADLFIEATPASPAAASTVTLQAKSYGVDLSQIPITWRYGGKVVASGIGKTQITVIAPQNGNSATATVSVQGANAATAALTLQPGNIDILWEATDAYTPPFYKGKALPATGGAIKVAAIPAVRAPNQLSYMWNRNGAAIPLGSGTGASSVSFRNTIFNQFETVQVQADGGLFEGEHRITITPRRPLAIAYQQSEGFIDFANGYATEIPIVGEGTTLRFEPYFFSSPTKVPARDLTFSLAIGGDPVFGDPAPNQLRLSRPAAGGTHTLDLSISTNFYSVQNLANRFRLIFR